MKLEGKKKLAARALEVGAKRILFNKERLSEIKEAITKQDIRDLYAQGAIMIKETSGRKVKVKRKTRRRAGSVKKKVKGGKREYITITRKLRAYLKELKSHEAISNEKYIKLRKEIRMKSFRDKNQLKERIANMEKE